LPITIVDIDAATHASWRQPIVTPRIEIVRLLELITAGRPAAVVVDIDLSGVAGAPSGESPARQRRPADP
jgi:CHASE2 domain-containing sensor protein